MAQRQESSLIFERVESSEMEIFQMESDASGLPPPHPKVVVNAILLLIIGLRSHANGDTAGTSGDKRASYRCEQVASFPAASPPSSSSWPRSLLASEGEGRRRPLVQLIQGTVDEWFPAGLLLLKGP